MKKIGDLMKEMGFNPNSPVETQKAFIKYLGRVSQKSEPKESPPLVEPLQLSFEFIDRPKAG